MLLINKIQTLIVGSITVSSASAFVSYLNSSKVSEIQKEELIKKPKIEHKYNKGSYGAVDYEFSWDSEDSPKQ